MFLIFSHRIWKVRCNIIHNKVSQEVYSDEENIYHAIIRELLSTNLSLIPVNQRHHFDYTFNEITKNGIGWIKAWIVTVLQCMDTEDSRERELDIAATRPIRANRKRKIITREICRQRDKKDSKIYTSGYKT